MHPYIVEFAGMPNTGKTSCVDLAADYYRRLGYAVRVVSERAQVCPFLARYRRRFATWMAEQAAHTVRKISGDQSADDTLVLMDRGILDALAFIELLFLEHLIDGEERCELIEESGILRYSSHVDLVLLFTADPHEVLKRDLIAQHFGLGGVITNLQTLRVLSVAYDRTQAIHGSSFRDIRPVVTDSLDLLSTLEMVLSHIEAGKSEAEPQELALESHREERECVER